MLRVLEITFIFLLILSRTRNMFIKKSSVAYMGYFMLSCVKKETKEIKPYQQNISISRTNALKFKGTNK